VHAFISTDKLIGKCQAWHETTFLQPENGGKAAREEDSFDGRKGDQTFTERGVLIADPSKCPVCLLLNARDSVNCIQQIFAFL
jgi:hypothetical protein